jgi:hypothetical protein
MDEVKVGGEVVSYCTTCKIMKDHVVVAMDEGTPAKVECLGCGKQHAYRPNPPGTRSKSPRPARRDQPVSRPPAEDLEMRLHGAEERARTYSPKERYAIDDAVRHPTFGVGVVVTLPAKFKMEVDFRGGRKLLVHDKGDGSAEPGLQRRPAVDESAPFQIPDAPGKS